MTVSVIIPTYNRAHLLARSLASVLSQTRPPDQVIVVDDGSTDDTGEVVEKAFAAAGLTDPVRRRYLRRRDNAGKAVAANVGIREAWGSLVWVFDDDDEAHPERLAKVVPLFDAHPDVDVVHTDGEWVLPDGSRRGWTARHLGEDDVLRAFLHGCWWFGISVIWRRSLLSRLLAKEWDLLDAEPDVSPFPYDPDLERAQDYDLWFRFAWAGARALAVNETTVTAHQHDGARGIGHRLDAAGVGEATFRAEQKILRKMHTRLSPKDVFGGEYCADHRVEYASVLWKRMLLDRAAQELLHVDGAALRSTGRKVVNAMARTLPRFVGEDGQPLLGTEAFAREVARIREAWAAEEAGALAAGVIL